MTSYLLDVNFLLSIVWDHHVHHPAARAWFSGRPRRWATATITELGFIRISSNRRFKEVPATVITAYAALAHLKADDRHEFLHELSAKELQGLYDAAQIQHAQVTDLYLLGLCAKHRCVLVTFDRGIEPLARKLALNAKIETLS